MFSSVGSDHRRILFIAEGSRGDCQPYLALAQGLKEAGFVLLFVTHSNFCEAYRSWGFDALGLMHDTEQAIRSNKETQEAMQSGDVKKFIECTREFVLPIYEDVLKKICAALEDFKPHLILHGGISNFLAASLSFQYGIPAVCAYLQLLSPTRFQQSMLQEPSWLPGWCHLAAHFLLSAMIINGWEPFRMIQKKVLPDVDCYLNSFAKQLVNLRHPLLQPMIGASAWINKVPIDAHPDNRPVITGAWVLDAAVQMRLAQAGNNLFGNNKDLKKTLAFLEASGGASPPVYIGWGSMIANSPQHMARLAVRTLMVLGRRGIIVGGFAELNESMLEGELDLQEYASKNVCFIPVAPHEFLFPKCAALVHHGGAGTFTAALRSGVPQVITPCILDQFAQAARVNELRVGVGLPRFQDCTVQKMVEALNLVLSDSIIQKNARCYGKELCNEQSSVALAVNKIKKDFSEEIDTGKWKARFEARKLLLTSKKAMESPSCWSWIRRIFFSSSPNDFVTYIK